MTTALRAGPGTAPPTTPSVPQSGHPISGRSGGATRSGAGLPWLSPVPDCEPPFDDELTGADRVRILAGRPTRRADPAEPAVRAASQPVRFRPETVTTSRVPGWSRERDVGVELTPSAGLPRADRIGWMFAQALIEVLAGTRPLAQLRAFCAADVFAGLEDQRVLRGSRPPRLVTARVNEPADGVAEVASVFRTADRVRAMAFRIRGIDGRWRITDLQIG